MKTFEKVLAQKALGCYPQFHASKEAIQNGGAVTSLLSHHDIIERFS
jgi:hypothetical protein